MPMQDETGLATPLDSIQEHVCGGGFEDWMARGEAAWAAGHLGEAARCFENALQDNPFNAKAYNGLSLVHWRQGNKTQALTQLTRALEMDPNDQRIILHCSAIFDTLGKQEDAQEILRSYLSRQPWDQEVQAALERLSAVPAEIPEIITPAYDIGAFFNEQGERQFQQGKLEHAKACFEMAIEHQPGLALAHSNLGVLCWQQGDLEKALEFFYQALRLDPEDPNIIYNSAKALAAAGELETALDYLKAYLQRNPRDEGAWNDYASLIKAIASSNWQPARLDGEVSQIYLEMGRALAAAKDLMGAAQAYQRAIQLNAEQGEPYFGLGQLHLELAQEDEALNIFREGLRVDPSYKPTVLSAGHILTSRGDMGEARDLYQTYLERFPDDEVQTALAAITAEARH